jgi:hypothetical protein
VRVTQGLEVRALIPRLNDMGALLVTDRGNGSGVVLFQDGDPAKSMSSIRAWPEVIGVHAEGLECMVYLCAIIGSGPSHSPARLIGGMPVRADEAVKQQDGRLQSQPGDMITVQHQFRRGEAFSPGSSWNSATERSLRLPNVQRIVIIGHLCRH